MTEGARVTFVGHSTLLIEVAGLRLLTDPVLRPRVAHIRRWAAAPAPEAVSEIDAVLLSHLHHDHFDPASLRSLGEDVTMIVPAGARGALTRRGFRDVIELGVDEPYELQNLSVVAKRVAHDGRRVPLGPAIEACGFLVKGAGLKLFFAGDTAPFDGLASVEADLDLAMLPISGWGPRLATEHHLGPATAAEAAAALAPAIVIPIHWGTLLRMARRGSKEAMLSGPAHEFEAEMRRIAPAVELRVLNPGESTRIERAPSREGKAI